MSESDIYVVVTAKDSPHTLADNTALVLETYCDGATLEKARETAKRFLRLGPCRIAKLEFVE